MTSLYRWLADDCKVGNISLITVTLTNGKRKRVEMPGASYTSKHGQFVYCLGNYNDLPLKSTSRTTILYFDENSGDYYIVAGYSTDSCLVGDYAKFHPFGHNVIFSKVDRRFVESEKHAAEYGYTRVLEGHIIIK